MPGGRSDGLWNMLMVRVVSMFGLRRDKTVLALSVLLLAVLWSIKGYQERTYTKFIPGHSPEIVYDFLINFENIAQIWTGFIGSKHGSSQYLYQLKITFVCKMAPRTYVYIISLCRYFSFSPTLCFEIYT